MGCECVRYGTICRGSVTQGTGYAGTMIHVTDWLPMRDVRSAKNLTDDARHTSPGMRDVENRCGPDEWCSSPDSPQ